MWFRVSQCLQLENNLHLVKLGPRGPFQNRSKRFPTGFMVPKPTQASPENLTGSWVSMMKKHLPSEKASKVPSVSFWVKKNTSATSTSQQRLSRSRHISPTHFEPRSCKIWTNRKTGGICHLQKKKGLTQKLFNLSSKVLRNFKSRSVTFLWEMDV